MRTPGAPVWMETVKRDGRDARPRCPGARSTPPSQQNVIDAAEAQFPAIVGAKLDEVITYITKTGHINLITGMVTSARGSTRCRKICRRSCATKP